MTDYATLAELKTQLRLTGTSNDTELQQKLNSARDRINKDCGRTFDLSAGVSQREYLITHETKLIVDDFSTETGLAIAVDSATGSAVAATNYRTGPDNAIAKGKAAWEIETRGFYCWPLGRRSAYVTANWGWAAVPDAIHDACLFLAARLFKRKDTPWGVAGTPETGLMRIAAMDPDYRALIDGYIKPQV